MVVVWFGFGIAVLPWIAMDWDLDLDLAFGIWRLAFGIWCLAFGVWNLAFGVWHSAFGIDTSKGTATHRL